MQGKKIGTMDKILAFLAVGIVIFIVVMVWLYKTTGAIPDTLCTCVFTVVGGECGIMGWIKTSKERHLERQYELEDREHEENKEEEKL